MSENEISFFFFYVSQHSTWRLPAYFLGAFSTVSSVARQGGIKTGYYPYRLIENRPRLIGFPHPFNVVTDF